MLTVATNVSSNGNATGACGYQIKTSTPLSRVARIVSQKSQKANPTEHGLALTMSRKGNSILGAIMEEDEAAGPCFQDSELTDSKHKRELTRVSLRREASWHHNSLEMQCPWT